MPRLHWWRLEDGAVPSRPVVALLAWAQSTPANLSRHAKLCQRLGADAVAVFPPLLALWLPSLARRSAEALLAALLHELPSSSSLRRPLLLFAFSGAPKTCLTPVLELLQAEPRFAPLAASLCGVAVDSGPVAFLSERGVKFLAPPESSGAARRLAVRGLAATMDALLAAPLERQRREFWNTLTALQPLPLAAPVLLLYSADDALAPAADVEAYAAALRARGRGGALRVVRWPSAPHVGALKIHPTAYEAAVRGWLEDGTRLHGGLRPRARL